jgi:NitT/TauT family transport system substrate-binding protein
MNTQTSFDKSPRRASARIFTFVGIAIVVIAAFVLLTSKSTAPKSQKIVINQAAHTLLYLPLYIAQANGYFKDEGLDVTVMTGGGDSQAFAAVVGGSAEFGQGDPMMVLLSRQNGGPGKIVGNVVGRVAFWGVAVDSKQTPITKPQDFAGKRVATYPAPNTIYALQQRALLAGDLKLGKDSFIVETQFGTELAALFAGKADIAMTLEPVVSQALAKGAHVVYSFPEQYGDFPLTGLMVKDELIQTNPELLQHALNAYQKALTYAYQDTNGAIAIAIKEFPDVDKVVIENAVRRMLSEETIPKVVTLNKDSFAKAAAVRREIGDLTKGISFEDAVDNQFADKAVRQFGPK